MSQRAVDLAEICFRRLTRKMQKRQVFCEGAYPPAVCNRAKHAGFRRIFPSRFQMQERQGACVFPDGSVHRPTRPKENVNATKYSAVFRNGVSKINRAMRQSHLRTYYNTLFEKRQAVYRYFSIFYVQLGKLFHANRQNAEPLPLHFLRLTARIPLNAPAKKATPSSSKISHDREKSPPIDENAR